MIPEAPLRIAIIMCTGRAFHQEQGRRGEFLTQVCDIVELSSRQSFIATCTSTYILYIHSIVQSHRNWSPDRGKPRLPSLWQPDMTWTWERYSRMRRCPVGICGEKSKSVDSHQDSHQNSGGARPCSQLSSVVPCRQHQPATSYDTQNTICLQYRQHPHSHGPIVSNSYRYLDLRISPCRHSAIYSRTGVYRTTNPRNGHPYAARTPDP